MLYDRDYMREGEESPWRSATMMLIAANISVFLFQCILSAYSSSLEAWFVAHLWLSPAAIRYGQVWQLLTFQFCHYSQFSNDIGLLHMLGNCLGLFFLGRILEVELGVRKFLALYLGSGVLGGLLQALLGLIVPRYFGMPTLGASAGVCGLLAAFAMRDPMAPISFLLAFVIPINMYAKTLLRLSFAIALFFVVVPVWQGVAHGAHLGGLLGGMLFMHLSSLNFHLPVLREKIVKHELVATSVGKRKSVWRANKPLIEEDLPPAEFISKEVDPILDKISAHGIHSLTKDERAILESARKKMQRGQSRKSGIDLS